MGFETILPLREGNGPTLFCFHPASGFAWQFSVLSRYLDPQWWLLGIQSPRPHGPMQTATNLDEVCKAHLATLLEQQPHGPYYLLGYSLGGTLGAGYCSATLVPVANGYFLVCWILWPPETPKLAGKRG
ncbi:thioesterase domain-containing protein [Escherichia coli]